MSKWNELSMRDRRDMIRLHVKNGISNLNEIRDSYNIFDGGGSKSSDKNTVKPANEMTDAEWTKMMEDKRDAAARRIADNPDITTIAANMLSYPVEWIKSPSRFIDDISDEFSGRQSQTARENWDENYRVARGLQSSAKRALDSAPRYFTNGLTMAAGAPKTIASVIAGDIISSDESGILEGANALTGLKASPISEFQKQSGGVSDIQQAIQNVKNKEYFKAAGNAATGAAGLFDSDILPANMAGVRYVDKGLEYLNAAGDIGDIFGLGSKVYEKIFERKGVKNPKLKKQ